MFLIMTGKKQTSYENRHNYSSTIS